MIDSNREEFEKLDEVKWILELCEYDSGRNMYDAKAAHCEFDEYHTNFVNGAWYAFQEQQKKLACCREENKAHLEKIDELQARVDEVLKACDNLRKDIIREHHAEYDKGWKDCATSIYHQLKGNKDETII